MENQNSGIDGIIPPVVTPFTEALNFDADSYKGLIDHVIRGGVNGIFILGTNGECASLTDVIRRDAISVAVAAAGSRVPVFVNVSTPSYKESVALSEIAAGEGADYIVISPPYYFDMDQDELFRYFDMIAGISRLPLFLYNAPHYTNIQITRETVSRLASHENIRGIKDSSGNIDYLRNLLKAREDPGFKIYVGTELLLGECISLGGNGGITGGANIFPELYVKMYQAAVKGEVEEQKRLQEVIKRVGSQIFDLHDSPNRIIIGMKYALSQLGICQETMAMPVYSKLNEKQKRTIKDFLSEYKHVAI